MRLLRSLKEVFISSLPLLGVMIVVFGIISPPTDVSAWENIGKIAIGYGGVVIGQTLFLVGLEQSVLPMGKLVGGSLQKLKKPAFIIMFGFVFGMVATVAEPALAVMAGQVFQITNNVIPSTLFIFILAAGIGVATAFALWRVIKNVNIKIVFMVGYIFIFVMMFFVPDQYWALAFDGSGATTGDMSVPFILALGMGVSMSLSKRKTNEDSFGIIGIASMGPIIATFVYGKIVGPIAETFPLDLGQLSIAEVLLDNVYGVLLSIVPILIIFLIFQFVFIKLPKKQLLRMLFGTIVVSIGLFIFLVGIDYGFSMAGSQIGDVFFRDDMPWLKWMLLLVGFVLGFAITLSEPAVTVLGDQVETITNGFIKKRTIIFTLATGIGAASLVSILKILLDVNIMFFLIPLYFIALVLIPFTPKLFVGLAFDSGGVTGGAITSAFLTPLTLAISANIGAGLESSSDVLKNGFGIIAFVSVTPLIAVQLLGVVFHHKTKQVAKLSKLYIEAQNNELSDLITITDGNTTSISHAFLLPDNQTNEDAING